MTEAEWAECADSWRMLESLRGTASDRKLRLFAAACFRRTWGRLHERRRSQRAIEILEAMADGLAGEAEMMATFLPPVMNFACRDGDSNLGGYFLGDDIFQVARNACYLTRLEVALDGQAGILRDLFGLLPFRPVAIDAAWLARNDGAVHRLAQVAYDDRHLPAGTLDPARLAVLADALEDAGCADRALLDHLRGPGPHVRGCWAVDAVSGRG